MKAYAERAAKYIRNSGLLPESWRYEAEKLYEEEDSPYNSTLNFPQ